jgi:hypothetical protein
VSALVDALNDQCSFVVDALGQLGAKALPEVPTLIEAMRGEYISDDDQSIPESAHALTRIGLDVIPHLVEALKSDDPAARPAVAAITTVIQEYEGTQLAPLAREVFAKCSMSHVVAQADVE